MNLAELLQENGVNYIEVLPYNKMAGGKYAMLLRKFDPRFDESVECNPRSEIFNSFGITQKIL